MKRSGYILVDSRFGEYGIVWQAVDGVSKVRRVILPRDNGSAEELIHASFKNVTLLSCELVEEVGERIGRFLDGEAVLFDLDSIMLEDCSPFQRKVLCAEHGIPRGMISTYGRLARFLGLSRGARAVGTALAHNPFPIIIPCHRAVRSDGHLGGFQGGLAMKRSLLEQEGIAFEKTGRVVLERMYY